jgi:hypothetical protein
MTEPVRTDRSSHADPSDRERDARIEELLLTGLNHYFSGQHELAINVWTRVLFLDRGHAKARAYIERARGAVAERQREAEELLHSGAAALDRGDHAEARQLLTSAVAHGSSGEEALALLHRLERLEVASEAPGGHVRPAFAPSEHPPESDGVSGRRDARVAWLVGGLVAGILIAALVGGYLWMVADTFDLGAARSPVPVVSEEPLPVPPACEMRLVRADMLFRQGRLREALRVLEPGDPDQQHQARYDQLRGTIQRQLIAEGRRTAGFSAVDEPTPGRSSTASPSRK